MSSRRCTHDTQTLQSPTVVQSPISPSSQLISSPITPTLTIEVDHVPFSKSFDPFVTPARRLSADLVRSSINGVITHSDSFCIERITNLKDNYPQWEDDEVEEIMVISSKPKNRLSTTKLNMLSNLGMSLPDLEVIDILGNKSSDQTFLARSRSNCSMFAIKSMTKQNASSPNLLKHVRSEQTCLRMITEGDLPFLPKLHRSFQDDTRLYMIMDMYPGGSLASHLSHEGTFSPDKSRFYASEIIEGLSFLHSLQIVHRDVKLENIMIAKDGHIVLTNFSCAKVLSNTGSPIPSTSSDCGTKEHQAPEMILGWKYDYTVDCWGFGVLLCIMHFGQHPFLEGDELNPLLIMQKRILRGQEPRYPLSSAPLSEWNLIKKCLECNPHVRPDTTQIKSHEYFNGIDWEKVKAKAYEAPFIPPNYEVKSRYSDFDEENFHFYEQSDLLEIDHTPVQDDSENLFDGYSFTWNPKSHALASSKLGDDTLGLPKASSSLPIIQNIRSIIKSRSLQFPLQKRSNAEDLISLSDFLDLDKSASRFSAFGTPDKPRKLRKRHSIALVKTTRHNKSSHMPSTLSRCINTEEKNDIQERRKLRKRCQSTSQTPISNLVSLPKGIVQSGRGIGFTYTPPMSRSRVSLASVNSRNCFGKLNFFNTKPITRVREAGMQTNGSTWSLPQSDEGRTSVVTLGMPEDVNRHIESNRDC